MRLRSRQRIPRNVDAPFDQTKDTQIEAFRRELQTENGFHGILGASASMQQVFDLISNASHSDAPVIIFGESGTGKELVAKAIHDTDLFHPNIESFVRTN